MSRRPIHILVLLLGVSCLVQSEAAVAKTPKVTTKAATVVPSKIKTKALPVTTKAKALPVTTKAKTLPVTTKTKTKAAAVSKSAAKVVIPSKTAVKSIAKAKVGAPAKEVAPPAEEVAPPAEEVAPVKKPAAAAAASCTTCADVFEKAGWDIADLPADLLKAVVDDTATTTCFVPPAGDLATLKLLVTNAQSAKSTAVQTEVISQILQYHVVTSQKLPVTPDTTPDTGILLATTASTTCGQNTLFVLAGTGSVTITDRSGAKVAAKLVPGTCKTTAAYTIGSMLQPCKTLEDLVASVEEGAGAGAGSDTLGADSTDATADPTTTDRTTKKTTKATDATADPTEEDTTPVTVGDTSNPVADCKAQKNCVGRALCDMGATEFASLLECSNLLTALSQGTKTYTMFAPLDDGIAQSNIPLSCTTPGLENQLRYYIIEGAQTFNQLAKNVDAKTIRVPGKDCAATTLTFNKPEDGTDSSVTGDISKRSSAVTVPDVNACATSIKSGKKTRLVPKVVIQGINRPLVTCCTERAKDVQQLMTSTDPIVKAFVEAFQLVASKDSAAEGTLFLPSVKAIGDFVKFAKSKKWPLTAKNVTWIAEYHFTRSIIQLDQVDNAAYAEDETVLKTDQDQQLCTDGDSWQKLRVTLSDSTAISTKAVGTKVTPGRYTIDTGVTNATITEYRTNCRGRIYLIDGILIPCQIVGLYTDAVAPVQDLSGGLAGLDTSGLSGINSLGSGTSSLNSLGTGTTTRGANTSSTLGLGGNATGVATLGLFGNSGTGSGAGSVAASMLMVVVAAAVAML